MGKRCFFAKILLKILKIIPYPAKSLPRCCKPEPSCYSKEGKTVSWLRTQFIDTGIL